MGRLEGKVAVVTGGSQGIGLAIGTRFVDEGAKVVLASRSGSSADLGPSAVSCKADVSNAGDVAGMIELAVQTFGGLDILVNNAAVQLVKTIEDTTEEEWDFLMDINLKGSFLCSKHALPHFRKRGKGAIVQIGSYDGFVADPHLAAYCASKGGVHALCRAIAVDHGRDNIRCNVIAPGFIKTDMMDDYLGGFQSTEEMEALLVKQQPVGRLGRPSDIASLATWLASDESEFATGQVFVHDGGLTAKAPAFG